MMLRVDLASSVFVFFITVSLLVIFVFFVFFFFLFCSFFFQAEDGIRYLVRSRGLGDVYKRQNLHFETPNELIDWQNLPFKVPTTNTNWDNAEKNAGVSGFGVTGTNAVSYTHLTLPTSDLV